MKWKKFTLSTTTEAVDLISSMLDEIGIEGIEIQDNVPLTEAETKGMFIDILPELPPDNGEAKVSFYLEDLTDLDRILKEIEEGLDELSLFVNAVSYTHLQRPGRCKGLRYGGGGPGEGFRRAGICRRNTVWNAYYCRGGIKTDLGFNYFYFCRNSRRKICQRVWKLRLERRRGSPHN